MAASPPPSRLPRDHFVDSPTAPVDIPRPRQGGRWVDPPAPPSVPPTSPRARGLAVVALVLGVVCLVLVVAGLVLAFVLTGI